MRNRTERQSLLRWIAAAHSLSSRSIFIIRSLSQSAAYMSSSAWADRVSNLTGTRCVSWINQTFHLNSIDLQRSNIGTWKFIISHIVKRRKTETCSVPSFSRSFIIPAISICLARSANTSFWCWRARIGLSSSHSSLGRHNVNYHNNTHTQHQHCTSSVRHVGLGFSLISRVD